MAEIREYIIDCADFSDRETCHDYLSAALSLPSYYGRNLDALYDCLTELPRCTVRLVSSEQLSYLDKYGNSLLAVFKDAAAANPDIELIID